jgi:broad specificity phosphatase PhoE
MKTHLYLLCPAASRRQAVVTRDFLAVRPFDHSYCSPDRAAQRTAGILAAPHGLTPQTLEALIEDAAVEEIEPCFVEVLARHEGQTLLVVAAAAVQRCYLATLLGLGPRRSRRLQVEPCGISVIVGERGRMRIGTLNAVFHLQGIAA